VEKVKKEIAEILTCELSKYFGTGASESLKHIIKHDLSLVTEIDYLVSNMVKEKILNMQQYAAYTFFSEEDHNRLKFPSIILDPIDGTIELLKGRRECVVSLAIMPTAEIADGGNYGWLYNPFSGLSIDSNCKFIPHYRQSSQQILGLVSRSEWHKGLYQQISNKELALVPRGSIAFKLGLLASGGCDFVLSRAPKNIWDIAAGTILLNQRGFSFYCQGVKTTHLDRVAYQDTLIWCHDSLAAKLLEEFKNEK
jgi:myo-inositol-1(or 4)-monophosphatase